MVTLYLGGVLGLIGVGRGKWIFHCERQTKAKSMLQTKTLLSLFYDV